MNSGQGNQQGGGAQGNQGGAQGNQGGNQGGGAQGNQGGNIHPYVQPVNDTGGIRNFPYLNPSTGRPYPTYQPYATQLANHLDGIRHLNGGSDSPAYNSYVNPMDKH